MFLHPTAEIQNKSPVEEKGSLVHNRVLRAPLDDVGFQERALARLFDNDPRKKDKGVNTKEEYWLNNLGAQLKVEETVDARGAYVTIFFPLSRAASFWCTHDLTMTSSDQRSYVIATSHRKRVTRERILPSYAEALA